ncbi:MAG: MFS transporter [Planctomycetaceae bacterium]|jgi:acyl-[acyl-carrier-protein]-phospholipid O-acyltransferase/long-chain-fatty-acid--[acyl-carrier-protein] ligase|nr:MFS transporter [Planctomycetaceae bacterium]
MSDSSADLSPSPKEHAALTEKTSCWNKGFAALLITQFTIAMNDNVFKWLLIPIGKILVGKAYEDTIRTVGGMCLLIPFLIFASTAGFATDRFCRRNVIIWCKFVEMFILFLAVIVICFMPNLLDITKITILLGILFILGAQSTFFSPCKYGMIPDLVPENQISNANGIMQMLTMIAIVVGQIVGGYLYAWTTIFADPQRSTVIGEPGTANWGLTFGIMVGTSFLGLIASFFIPKFKPVSPETKFVANIFKETHRDLKMLISYRSLFGVAIASAFFWGLAVLSQTNIDKYASDFLKVRQEHVTVLAAILVLGIGGGSALAGWFSRGRIELGMVPIGALGMGFFVLLLGFTPSLPASVGLNEGSVISAGCIYGSVCLMLLGLAAGLYDVPLASYLQKNSPPEKRGRVIAAYNFFSFSSMLLFSGLYFVLTVIFNRISTAPSLWIWVSGGILVFLVLIFLTKTLIVECSAFLLRLFFRVAYRYQILGEENIPEKGGVLLLSNHVSYLDGLLIYVSSSRPVRFFAHADYIPPGVPSYLAGKTRVMKIVPGKRSVVDAIKQAREGLANGDVIGIFPEGGITRTGQIKEFEPGYTAFLKGNENVPVVPVFIGGLYGSIFSYEGHGRSFRQKILRCLTHRLRRRVIVRYGKPVPGNTPVHVVKHLIDEMAAEAAIQETGKQFVPVREALRLFKSRVHSKQPVLIDSMGVEMKPKDFLLRSFVVQRILRREILKKNEKSVAIFVPPSTGGVVINFAAALSRRIVTNLNYTFNSELLNYCLNLVEAKHVLTSRKILERFHFEFNTEVVCLEDMISKVRLSDKIIAAVYTYVFPAWLVERLLGLHQITAEDTNTIVFTSGSTGQPKGVMLSNRGISENVDGFKHIVRLTDRDGIFNVLPFFHAFGYTVGIWAPLCAGVRGIYHYSPLEPKVIGKMSQKYRPAFMVTTSTFLRSYLRRCPREDFEHLESVVVGAEKLQKDICDAWEEKYGVRPVEGYGTTELSPVVCTNIPKARHHDDFQPDSREGSIGRPMPNIAAKIVDVDTWEEMPVDTPGMLVIKSPTVMQGYYKQPELTAQAIRDGWNITGDVARIDKDGFIFITGRESRISKIGGEMVPHIMIEEKLLEIYQKHLSEKDGFSEKLLSDPSGDAAVSAVLVVGSVPDSKKGERLVVLFTQLPVSPDEMCRELRESGCPLIWVPLPQSFYQVESIPVLGSGKLDLAAVKKKIQEICTEPR